MDYLSSMETLETEPKNFCNHYDDFDVKLSPFLGSYVVINWIKYDSFFDKNLTIPNEIKFNEKNYELKGIHKIFNNDENSLYILLDKKWNVNETYDIGIEDGLKVGEYVKSIYGIYDIIF